MYERSGYYIIHAPYNSCYKSLYVSHSCIDPFQLMTNHYLNHNFNVPHTFQLLTLYVLIVLGIGAIVHNVRYSDIVSSSMVSQVIN